MWKTVLLSLGFVASVCGLSKVDVDGMPFGYGNAIPIQEVEGFPSAKDFFNNYARKNVPVVMRGANKIWPGFTKWQTDEYFRSVAPEEPFIISLDKKRGNPDSPHQYVDFKKFLNDYHNSSRRMIEFTPDFIKDDVLVPTCLDCAAITDGEMIMGQKMWFGYNYTTSVVHKDAADNINCLVYGVKNYTIVEPKYDKYVLLDRPDGLYSTMDVDKVDLEKYPGLENVVYQVSELHGGDCIFVPYKWIHQVRSYGRNIAVNVWWNYWKNKEFDLDSCPDQLEKAHTIKEIEFQGWGDFETRDEGVKEHFTDLVFMLRDSVDVKTFAKLFSIGLDADAEDLQYIDDDVLDALVDAFDFCDMNEDEKTDIKEIRELPEERLKKVIEKIKFVFRVTRDRAVEELENQKKEEKEKRQKKEKANKMKEKNKEKLKAATEDRKHDEF